MQTPIRFTICHLQRDPPLEVHDLFTDVQDGRMLLALLEELSGCKLVRVEEIFDISKEKKMDVCFF